MNRRFLSRGRGVLGPRTATCSSCRSLVDTAQGRMYPPRRARRPDRLTTSRWPTAVHAMPPPRQGWMPVSPAIPTRGWSPRAPPPTRCAAGSQVIARHPFQYYKVIAVPPFRYHKGLRAIPFNITRLSGYSCTCGKGVRVACLSLGRSMRLLLTYSHGYARPCTKSPALVGAQPPSAFREGGQRDGTRRRRKDPETSNGKRGDPA